jgi:hypothetical protein
MPSVIAGEAWPSWAQEHDIRAAGDQEAREGVAAVVGAQARQARSVQLGAGDGGTKIRMRTLSRFRGEPTAEAYAGSESAL